MKSPSAARQLQLVPQPSDASGSVGESDTDADADTGANVSAGVDAAEPGEEAPLAMAKAQPATRSPENNSAAAALEPQRSSDARPMAGQPSGDGSAELAPVQLEAEAAAELVSSARWRWCLAETGAGARCLPPPQLLPIHCEHTMAELAVEHCSAVESTHQALLVRRAPRRAPAAASRRAQRPVFEPQVLKAQH